MTPDLKKLRADAWAFKLDLADLEKLIDLCEAQAEVVEVARKALVDIAHGQSSHMAGWKSTWVYKIASEALAKLEGLK